MRSVIRMLRGLLIIGAWLIITSYIGRLLVGPSGFINDADAPIIVRYGDYVMWPALGTLALILLGLVVSAVWWTGKWGRDD